MHDLVTVMSKESLAANELLNDEIFAEFANDLAPGDNRNFDPLNGFVPVEEIIDDQLNPLEHLISLEELSQQDFGGKIPSIGVIKTTMLCINLDLLKDTYFGGKSK
ncbi:MAG: hypothetical protein WCG01_01595 [bacterium]